MALLRQKENIFNFAIKKHKENVSFFKKKKEPKENKEERDFNNISVNCYQVIQTRFLTNQYSYFLWAIF